MVRRQQVNINTAGEEEIQTLPGVSFIQARRICMERPFRSTEELMRVRGVSVGLLQQWEEGSFCHCHAILIFHNADFQIYVALFCSLSYRYRARTWSISSQLKCGTLRSV